MFTSPGAVAIELGIFTIHWYGILICLGFIVALVICTRIAKEKGENPDNFTDLASIILIASIIGARVYYVLFNLHIYLQDPLSMFKIWEGGLAIHGALIGGLIAGYLYTRYKKLSFLKYCDISAYGIILGQAIGRWGNFFNSEAFGGPTNLPWKLFIPLEKRPEGLMSFSYFHPTFLYESLWNICVFCILYFVLRKKFKNKDGIIFACYLGLYSLGRVFIEGLRTDSLYLIEGIRTAQVVSVLLIIISIIGIKFLLHPKQSENQENTVSE